ncbi:MAG: hypothetical protein ACT452_09480 [Microthrixaceae bacterium]
MRLLQLATGPDEVLDLHPHVSVVTGLSPQGRSILVDAVTRLARGEAVPGPGLLEAHGVLFDVDPALLALLDPSGDDVDPVVQAVQLPAQPISLDARELRSREDAFAVLLELISAQAERRSAARDTLDAATAALEAAHGARAEAAAGGERRQADVDRLARRLEALADERRRVRREVEEARHALAGARSVRDDVEARTAAIRDARDAAVALRASIETELSELDAAALAAQAELDAQAELRAGTAGASDPERDDLEEAIDEDAAARARELEQLLVALVPVERMLVEEALAQMGDGATGDRAPSPEAMHLADELDRVATELATGDDDDADADDDAKGLLDEARERLDRARSALVDAEHAVRSPELDRDDILKLEDIHGELIEAIEKAEGRFGRTRAANRVAELRSAEQEVLDRLGFSSYSAYMMGYSLNDADPAKEAELDRAREELSAAEDAWAQLEHVAEPTRQRSVALDRRRALLQHAAGLLGGEEPESPQEALRALRVDPLPRSEAAPVLAAALDAVGVDLGDEDLEPDDLVMLAEAWLAEAEHVERARRAAADELDDVRAGRWSPPTSAADLADPPPIDDDPREALARDLPTAREMEQSAVATAAAADQEVAAVGAEVIELEVRVAALEEDLARVDIEVAAAEEALGGLSADADLPDLDVQLDAAKAVHAEALAAMDVVDQAMATLDAEGRAEAAEIERLQDLVAEQATGTATPAEELEWYLLARLAAQRSVSIAGSAPLLLDDALTGLGVEEVCHLLTRLERMADVVQVIVLSEDPVVASWAVTTGIARAAVVVPSPVSAAR